MADDGSHVLSLLNHGRLTLHPAIDLLHSISNDALMLICSRFQQSDTNHRYDMSRWVLIVSMALMVLHYYLQMRYDIRETNDDMGMLVNILFYAPVAYHMMKLSKQITVSKGNKTSMSPREWCECHDAS